jgi:hypothetical protein
VGPQETRRIVLTVLTTLLIPTSHWCDISPRADTRDEILAADLAGVAMPDYGNGSPPNERYCTLATGIIRKRLQVSRSCRIFVKASISEAALDWLVCAETMDIRWMLCCLIAAHLTQLSVCCSGRDTTVAVAHGHREPAESEALAYAALAQLIVSFLLSHWARGCSSRTHWLAWVGSRRYASFKASNIRMLKCLKHVRGYRTGLRNMNGMALQKS